jgi:hypothetical protein
LNFKIQIRSRNGKQITAGPVGRGKDRKVVMLKANTEILRYRGREFRVAHTYNPSYSRCRYQEDGSLRPDHAKISRDLHLNQ